ncbi:MAG: DUF1080 domain-containing protein [Planctomycetes bacterium]|nr:DUF1080 domain-containing protein [Planctomycetota bacterium]
MKSKVTFILICFVCLAAAGCSGSGQYKWEVHDMNRPVPDIVTAGKEAGSAPSNAIILFDGRDISKWELKKNGKAAKWKVENGYMEVAKKAGDIRTKQKFGDCQLHIEWAAPIKVKDKSQGRGNSGVFLMGLYEVQVLDSFNNRTYADGQAGALYGQSPPLYNVCRGPGKWQSYDIIFRRPRFAKNGSITKAGRVTVLHNGIIIQDSVELLGPTEHKKRAKYKQHADKLPIILQDHGNKVRYRNIWLIELSEEQGQ